MPPLSASPIDADRDDRTAPLRLLLLTDTSVHSAGGSERFLRNLVSRLPADRYRITLMQLAQSKNDVSDERSLSDLGHVQLHRLPIGAVYGPRGWRALRVLSRLLRRQRFDIVQSQHEKSDVINALLPRIPGTVHISNRRDMGFNKSSRLRLLFRVLNYRYDCVVAPAQPILSGLADSEDLALRRMLWIPNGVDTERFRPHPQAARSERRRALGLDDAAVVFGCVASLSPVKRHVDLIDAFAKVRERVPQAHLLLIGQGPLRSEVAAQIAALGLEGAVHLLGDLADVETILSALDVAVLASSTEGMSNALLEAMACGLPVVATAVGGNLQLVQPDVNGLLVPSYDPPALASAMLALAEAPELRKRMGAAARARIERDFSLAGMADSFDRMYRRLLGLP